MIKEVTLCLNTSLLHIHRLICMLPPKWETGEDGNLSDHKAELSHGERKALPKSYGTEIRTRDKTWPCTGEIQPKTQDP